MDYIELEVSVNPRQPATDLLISELAEAGFESFVETEKGFLAYIPGNEFSETLISPLKECNKELAVLSYKTKTIAGQNWNAEWESSYQPIRLGNKLLIRAPFHPEEKEVEISLEIQPQQSFGTGHHPTTRLMAQKLLTMPLHERYILDMGCGTGVLAILAAKLGAAQVLGIDIESNAVLNAIENVHRNKVENVTVEEGTENKIGDRKFDLVLANINKNALLGALKTYTGALNKNGELLMSGFFVTDVADLVAAAENAGLQFNSKENEEEWALLHFTKK